jgi:uncharacterized membrane protein
VISFYVIAQFWLVHYRVFHRVAGQREGLAWWNFAFLFTISVMPFTSDLLGKYSANPLAVDIFALNLLAASLATQATLLFSRRAHLLITETSAQERQAAQLRVAANVFVIVLSAGLAWVNTGAPSTAGCCLPSCRGSRVADRWSARRAHAYGDPAD